MEQARKYAAEIFTLFKCILLNEMKDFILFMMPKSIYTKAVGTHAEFTV